MGAAGAADRRVAHLRVVHRQAAARRGDRLEARRRGRRWMGAARGSSAGGPPGGPPPGGGWGPPGGAPPGGHLAHRPEDGDLQGELRRGDGDLQGAAPPGDGAPRAAHPAAHRPADGARPPAATGAASGRLRCTAGLSARRRAYAPPGGGARSVFSPGEAITFAWERVKADPGTILATVIVGMILVWVVAFVTSFMAKIVAGVGGASTSRHVGSAFDMLAPLYLGMAGIGSIIDIVVSSFIVAGIMSFSLKVAKGLPYTFGDLFSGAPFFVSVLVANFVSTLAIGLGMLFLIVPGVISALGLCMTLPLVIDRKLGPIDALHESWKLTDGHKTNLFIFGLIAVGLAIAGACACGVGILLVMPILYIAHMYIYLKLTGQPVAAIGQAR